MHPEIQRAIFFLLPLPLRHSEPVNTTSAVADGGHVTVILPTPNPEAAVPSRLA